VAYTKSFCVSEVEKQEAGEAVKKEEAVSVAATEVSTEAAAKIRRDAEVVKEAVAKTRRDVETEQDKSVLMAVDEAVKSLLLGHLVSPSLSVHIQPYSS